MDTESQAWDARRIAYVPKKAFPLVAKGSLQRCFRILLSFYGRAWADAAEALGCKLQGLGESVPEESIHGCVKSLKHTHRKDAGRSINVHLQDNKYFFLNA